MNGYTIGYTNDPQKAVYGCQSMSMAVGVVFEHQDTLHPVVFDLSGKSGRFRVAGVTGLEPATSCVTGRRSNQLSYTPKQRPAKSNRSLFPVKS